MFDHVLIIFGLLVACHFLADFPLQGEYLSKSKDHTKPENAEVWFITLMGHSAIHAMFVGIVTQSPLFAVVEFISHACIDWLKCSKLISFRLDQLLHIVFKLSYAFVIFCHTLRTQELEHLVA